MNLKNSANPSVGRSCPVEVRVGRQAIRASAVTQKLFCFWLPPGVCELRIVSGAAVPAEVDPASEDRRRLGAKIGAIFLGGEFIPLHSPVLADGFHPIERRGAERWRWTDGAARLILPRALARPVILELLVRDLFAGQAAQRADLIRAA